MTLRKPENKKQKVFFILLRILILAAVIHVFTLSLEHYAPLSKLGKDGEILAASIADHITFGWD